MSTLNKPPKPKDKNKPKTNPSSYLLWANEVRPLYRTKYPTLSPTERAKILGVKWSEMSDKEKQPYTDKASVLRKEYKNKLKEYKDTECYRIHTQKMKMWQTKCNEIDNRNNNNNNNNNYDDYNDQISENIAIARKLKNSDNSYIINTPLLSSPTNSSLSPNRNGRRKRRLYGSHYYITGQCKLPSIIIPEIDKLHYLQYPLSETTISKIQSISSQNVLGFYELDGTKFHLKERKFPLSPFGRNKSCLSQIRKSLFNSNKKILCEPDKLLIYQTGSYYNQNCNKTSSSLIISLPTYNPIYDGGEYILSYNNQQIIYKHSYINKDNINYNLTEYLAIYKDVQTETKPIISGIHVELRFNILIIDNETYVSDDPSSLMHQDVCIHTNNTNHGKRNYNDLNIDDNEPPAKRRKYDHNTTKKKRKQKKKKTVKSRYKTRDKSNKNYDIMSVSESEDDGGKDGDYIPPTLKSEDDDDSDRDYDSSYYSNSKSVTPPIKYQRNTVLLSPAAKNAKAKKKKNPNTYYYRFNKDGETQINGAFTAEEHKRFMERVKEVGVNLGWGIFSKPIKGRVGYQISNYWRKLIEDGDVIDPNYYTVKNAKIKFKKKNELPVKPDEYDAFRRFSFTILKDPSGTCFPVPWVHPKRPVSMRKIVKNQLVDRIDDYDDNPSLNPPNQINGDNCDNGTSSLNGCNDEQPMYVSPEITPGDCVDQNKIIKEKSSKLHKKKRKKQKRHSPRLFSAQYSDDDDEDIFGDDELRNYGSPKSKLHNGTLQISDVAGGSSTTVKSQ